MAINSVIHTNQHSIDRVLQAGLPVALVFWQENEPNSRRLESTLDALAARFAGQALIAKLNAAEEKALVQRYDVHQLPTIVFVKDGQRQGTVTGVVDQSGLAAWLTYLVEGGQRPSLPSGPSTPMTDTTTPSRASRPHANGNNHARQPANGTTGPSTNGGGKPVTLTDANFQQVINGGQPVLVDFWAPWCGPCRMVAPSVEQLAQEFQGKAVVGKLNVDENPRTARQYEVMSIPTLYIFKKGQVVDRLVGAQPLPVLRQRLARYAG